MIEYFIHIKYKDGNETGFTTEFKNDDHAKKFCEYNSNENATYSAKALTECDMEFVNSILNPPVINKGELSKDSDEYYEFLMNNV